MKKKTTPAKTNEAAPANPTEAAVPAIIPPAYTAHDPKLSKKQLADAIAIGAKHPDVIMAVEEFRATMMTVQTAVGAASDRYFNVVIKLRDSKLVRADAILLLKSLGLHKVVISKMLAVVELPEVDFAKYEARTIGFNAAALLGQEKRAEALTPEQKEAKAKAKAAKAQEKVNPFPATVRAKVEALLVALGEADIPAAKNGNPYEYNYSTAKGRVYRLSLLVL